MEKELVTIITPCYNGEQFLNKYFMSIINQTYKHIELIVVNDGSTDKTEEVLVQYEKEMKENRIIYKHFKQENLGQASAINKALPNVNGEFLYWMDCDDCLEYNGIEKLVDFLKKHQDYNIVRGKVRILKDNKTVRIGKPKKSESEYIFENYMFAKNAYCFPGTFMVRMEDFDQKIKGRSIYCTRAGQNWQLLLPILYEQKCGFVDNIVYNYNIIENSHSKIKVNTFEEELKRIESHIDILYNVLNPMKIWKKYQEEIELLYDRRRIRAGLQYDKYEYIVDILKHEKDVYTNYKKNLRYWMLKNKAFYNLYRKVKFR